MVVIFRTFLLRVEGEWIPGLNHFVIHNFDLFRDLGQYEPEVYPIQNFRPDFIPFLGYPFNALFLLDLLRTRSCLPKTRTNYHVLEPSIISYQLVNSL